MRKWLARLGLGFLAVSAAVSAGCAQERAPINRVQPQAIPKNFFVGKDYVSSADDPEFYARTMFVDVPYGADSWGLFTNSLNKVVRIKWQVQEKELIGRITYERIPGTDGKGKEGAKSNEGQIIYVFPIESHFDIRRDYNSTTGEEVNVVVENSSDRPWYQRDYIRVDWSRNLNTHAYDFDTLAFIGFIDGVQYDSMAFNITDPNSKHAPVFDFDKQYFDVTNKVFAQPKMMSLPEAWGGGSYPACLLPSLVSGGTAPNGLCNSVEITVRNSFIRVVDKDYEPEDWDGFKFRSFGSFYTERYGSTREYGMVDAKWYRFIERYNIWERSHYYENPSTMQGAISCNTAETTPYGKNARRDEDDKGNGNGTDDECEAVTAATGFAGSKCDTFNKKCTLPYRARTEKPVVWHYAKTDDADIYYEATREATFDWDAAMRIAVDAARWAECKSTDQKCTTPSGDPLPKPVSGQFAEEEDLIRLVREIEACRRGDVPDWAGQCEALADDLKSKRSLAAEVAAAAKKAPMVILCNSPVSDTDAPECGKRGTVARLGDLRYHLVTSIWGAQTGSPWGIMTDANDPLTGEKVAASVNIWTDINDRFSQGVVDTLRYIAGELPLSEISEGSYVYDWAKAAEAASANGQIMPRATAADVSKSAAAVANLSPEKAARVGKVAQDDAKVQQILRSVMAKMSDTHAHHDAPSVNGPAYEARRQAAIGSDFEAALVTPAMQQLAGSSPLSSSLTTGQKTAIASPLRTLNPRVQREIRNAYEVGMAKHGVCIMNHEATSPLGYIPLRSVLEEKFGKFNAQSSKTEQQARADRMKDYMRRQVQYAVIAHEMGHSFGLRHNFVSSSDAYNYRPQYWQLRTNDKAANSARECAEGTTNGAACVGPRRFDPITENESKNMIQLWMHSSTMEYPGEPTQDLLALGGYDFGAARMFYGGTATVYADPAFKKNTNLGKSALDKMDTFGGILGIRYTATGDSWSKPIHYSQLDKNFNLLKAESCKTVKQDAFKPVHWNEERDGKWHPMLDGHIVTNESGAYTRCKQQDVDFVQWSRMAPRVGPTSGSRDADGNEEKPAAFDKSDRVRVPYGFATDDWADLGNLSVYRHDNGADAYELTHFWIAQQEINHIFSSYRRGRTDFSIHGAFERNISRYHEKMRDMAKGLSLFVQIARDTASTVEPQDGDEFVAGLLNFQFADNTLASSIAFDHFAHVFARPQAGGHAVFTAEKSGVLRSVDDQGFASPPAPALIVPNGVAGSSNGFGNVWLGGRPLENMLASNKGDFDRDYNLNCGSYYEKAFIPMLMTESVDNFISASRSDYYDPRFRSVSLSDMFPEGFRRFLANNLTGDDQLKGPRVVASNGAPTVDGNKLPSKGIGWISWWPSFGPEVCFPGSEALNCQIPGFESPQNLEPTLPLDPEVGWEQQKFLVAMTLGYLPENQKQTWIDQMRVWELGAESDPGFENRIELHDPSGRVYVAKTFGTEMVFGKKVQKGIGARVLEYANSLMKDAYVTTEITKNGVTWYKPVIGADGNPQIKNPKGAGTVESCAQNWNCVRLQKYVSLPAFIRQAMRAYGITVDLRGVY